jgi:predicted amidophosphoribosyltransferase
MTLRSKLAQRICWGAVWPDSPQRPLCAICHGPLPEVPLMMWRPDGSAASFCDSCAEEVIVSR